MTGIRPEWHFEMIRTCQHIAGSLVRPYTEPEEALLTRILTSTPPAETQLEASVQWSLLRLCAQRWALLAHQLYHAVDGRRCRKLEDPAAHWNDAAGSGAAVEAVIGWAANYCAAFRRDHPDPLPFRIMGAIDATYDRAVTVREIAAKCGISSRRVRRVVMMTCGRSFQDYRKELRITHAAGLLRTTDIKVEAIAMIVGFRSKKSLYVGVRSAFGRTPATLREVSKAADRPPIEARPQLRLVCAGASRRDPGDGC